MTLSIWEFLLTLLGTSGLGALIAGLFSWRKDSAEATDKRASAEKNQADAAKSKADAAQILVETAINNIVEPLTERVKTLESEMNQVRDENSRLIDKVKTLEGDKARTALIIETLSLRLTKAVGHIETLTEWISGLSLSVDPPEPPRDIWGDIPR